MLLSKQIISSDQIQWEETKFISYWVKRHACTQREGIYSSHLWRLPRRKGQGKHCKEVIGGFPGGAVVESLPANAGDTGSSPGLGGSHMPRSNWAREPQLLSLRVWSLCSAIREAAIVRGPRTAMKSGPRLPQLEKALAQKRRPNTVINKEILKKKKKRSDWIGPGKIIQA